MFNEVAALTTGRQVLVPEGGAGEAERFEPGNATPNLFRLLGARIVQRQRFHRRGRHAAATPPRRRRRGQAPASRTAPPPPPRAILSHEFWQRRFGGESGGRRAPSSRSASSGFEVVGVLEPGFEMLFPPGVNIERAPDVWTPMRVDFAAGLARQRCSCASSAGCAMASTIEQAQEEVDAIAADLRGNFRSSRRPASTCASSRCTRISSPMSGR